MSYEGVSKLLSPETRRGETHWIVSVDFLCWHIWPLLDVGHLECRVAVPISILAPMRSNWRLSSMSFNRFALATAG